MSSKQTRQCLSPRVKMIASEWLWATLMSWWCLLVKIVWADDAINTLDFLAGVVVYIPCPWLARIEEKANGMALAKKKTDAGLRQCRWRLYAKNYLHYKPSKVEMCPCLWVSAQLTNGSIRSCELHIKISVISPVRAAVSTNHRSDFGFDPRYHPIRLGITLIRIDAGRWLVLTSVLTTARTGPLNFCRDCGQL